MGNNLYSSLVNFYNVNDENFKEFMAELYKILLTSNRDIEDMKKHLEETVYINNLVTLTTDTQEKNCTKLNKNITLTFRTDNTNIVTGTIIGNVDTSIRPKRNIVVPCVGLNGAGNSVQAYGQATLKTNGDIQVTLSSSCSFLAISFSYNI